MSTTDLPELIAIGDVRVSERGGRDLETLYSFDNQAARIAEACRTQGWKPGPVFDEGFVSAGEPLAKRPKLEAAIKMIEDGKGDVLVFAFKDRMDREPAVRDQIIDRVEAAGGIVYTGDHGIDTNKTAVAQFTGGTLSLVGRLVRRQSGEKSREAIQESINLGRYPHKGGAPLGFDLDDERRLIPGDDRATVENAFILRSEGASIDDVGDYLRSEGFVLSHKQVRQLLANRAYVGEIHFGTYTPNLHAHDPIVDRLLFDDVRALSSPRGPRTEASDMLLARQQVLRCGTCNARMVANHHANRADRYRCPQVSDCPAKASIVAHAVDDAVRDKLYEDAGDTPGEASALDEARAADRKAEALDKRLQDTLARLLELDLLDEPASQTQLAKLRDEAREAAEHADELHHLANAETKRGLLREKWNDLTLDEKRSLIRTFIRSVVIDQGVSGPERIHITMVGAR